MRGKPPPPADNDNRLSMESDSTTLTSVTSSQSASVVRGAKPKIVHIEVDDKQVPGKTIIRVIPMQNDDDDASTVISDATSTWDAGTVVSDAETLRSLSSIPTKNRPQPPAKPKPAVMPRPAKPEQQPQPAVMQFQKLSSASAQDKGFSQPPPPLPSKPQKSAPNAAVTGKKPVVAIEKQTTATKDDESDSSETSTSEDEEEVEQNSVKASTSVAARVSIIIKFSKIKLNYLNSANTAIIRITEVFC